MHFPTVGLKSVSWRFSFTGCLVFGLDKAGPDSTNIFSYFFFIIVVVDVIAKLKPNQTSTSIGLLLFTLVNSLLFTLVNSRVSALTDY